MEIDEQKKKIVKEKIDDVSNASGGIAYCHFVEYKFLNSLNQPKRNEFVDYQIYRKTSLEAMQIWIEGLASLKQHDANLKTNLFSKNFTEELYFSGEKRVSLHIEGKYNANALAPINVKISNCTTPSGYEYFHILFEVNKLIPATYTINSNKRKIRSNGNHGDFMRHVMEELSSMSNILYFTNGDFSFFDTEIVTKIISFPELKGAEEALRMAILFTWPTTKNPQKSYVALIPPAFEISEKTGHKQITAGGLAFFSNNTLILPPSSPLFDSLQNWVSVHTTKRLVEYSRNESIKSAKAAIMSRNMSHNLGSHVMFYIKQKLESVNNIYKEGALEELLQKGSAEDLKNQLERLLDNGNVVDLIVKLLKKGSAEDLKNQLERSLDNGNVVDLKKQLEQIIRIGDEMPFLVGLGRFINYLQERQDYIATVATDYIPYKSSINFKDAIYDELKPDLRFRRHKEDESIKGKQPANLLLEYIAYSEGFKDSERIELFFGEKFNGTGTPSQVPQELRQFNIALPGGNLGRQAFFSIMENIIRNTAKHDGAKMAAGSKLKFRFDLIEFSNKNEVDDINLFAWTNSDNYPTESNKIQKIYHEHRNDLYFLGITVDIDIDKTIAENSLIKIKDGLGIEYINENGSMNEDCKGIKEIRISAAWMRGFKIDTDIPNSEPPAVAIRENDGKLQYIICLPKPKKIAIVGSKTSTVISNNGIQFFAPNDLDADKNRSLADFELIVCSEKDAKEIRGSVGSRILITDNVYDNATDVVPDKLYMEWLHNTFDKDEKGLPKLIINDEKAYKYKHFAESKGNKSVSDKIYEYVDYELIKQDLIRCNSADSHSDQIVYSKHYTGQKDISECYPKAFFLEGVSGGNTTDRLIRQEKWTTEWYVKQMAAGLTKIAIFDERIHDNFVQKTENLKEWNKDKIKAWLNEVINKNGENKGDRIIINSGVIQDKLKEEFLGLLKLDDVGEEDGKLNFIMATDDKMFENAVNKLQVSSQTDYSTAALFAQKGIWAFNISSDKGVVTINGFSKRKNKDVNAAQIRMDNNSKVECSIIEDEFLNIFHFISIHQGILDKIYETLGIMEDIDKKKEVTSELFNKFADNSCGEKSPEDFLPQFIIHSGRSHPNHTDMPQKQPFIQFAALDHAVRDCKYTLTELLYSAHYE